MAGIDSYMNTYLDRRMKYLIEEWQLATRHDVRDFSARLLGLSEEISRIDAVEKAATDRLSALEDRAKRMEGSG